jgi:2-keto-3-deoxy-L-rhamnonate aldolase RhmA
MKRAVFMAALLLVAALAADWPQAQQAPAGREGGAQGGGAGRQGGGRQGGGGGAQPAVRHANGTLTPMPLDPGRPWGWATKAFMTNPNRKLYNKAKTKLLSGAQVFSFTQSRFDPEQYCMYAPHYDFTWFEMQHSTLRFDQVQSMITACPLTGATPMIRMPDALEANMQKAYDLGVLGTIVPTVDDVFEARDASRYAHFPPQGRRSQGGSQLWNNFLNPGETYRNSINDNVLAVVMIETPEGVDNAYEIASTPGLDVVILGNSDLTSFSGFAQDSNEYQDLLTRVRDATYKAGKYWGNAGQQFSTGNRLSPDSRFHQNGKSNDGWTPPARGNMTQAPAQ